MELSIGCVSLLNVSRNSPVIPGGWCRVALEHSIDKFDKLSGQISCRDTLCRSADWWWWKGDGGEKSGDAA